MAAKAIIMHGNLSEGYEAIGPFKDLDDAGEYADRNGYNSCDSWIMTLIQPGKEEEDG